MALNHNLQKQMQELFGGSCLGYCYAYICGKTTAKELTKTFMQGWFDGYICDNGYVAFPVCYLNDTCKCHVKIKDVLKYPIKSLDDLPNEYELFVVEYKIDPSAKESHFVVASRFGVEFDPSGHSNTVEKGKPFSYRLLLY